MANDEDLPLPTLEELRTRKGYREVSPEEFEELFGGMEFLESGRGIRGRERLVDCTLPENDGKLCFETDCFQGKKGFRFCQNLRCQKSVVTDC